jgi:D-apionolactonase
MSAQLSSEDRILLKTRQLSCFFEPQTGFLRRVTVDGCEVIRAIYGAVRDQNWTTVQPKIVIGRRATSDDHFRLEFRAECSSGEIAFGWNGTIEASAGTLSFAFAGEAKSTFKKNRIGLCLLHPIRECAGHRCQVRDTSDCWIETEFPLFISPHQPFKGLGAISWEPRADLKATVAFTGEIFETEDQRNWTDASFKTYCTPLDRPFPVEIKKGRLVDQRITVELQNRGARSRVFRGPDQNLIFLSANGEKPLPSLGVCTSSYREPLTETERARMAALHLDHFRVEVRFDDPRWRDSLEQAMGDARGIGVRLQAALFLSGNEDLHAFASAVDHQILQTCLVFHKNELSTSEQWLELASKLLPRHTAVGGTDAYFAELNRRRPTARFPIAFSINPQVHAFDDLSLIENLEAQPETVHSARQIYTSPLYISPITLRPRSNPNATNLSVEPSDCLPSSVDPRQRTLFGAAWTVGSLARLLPVAGIESLTYYEAIGWKGLMEAEHGNPLPGQFASSPGEIFPVYHVFHVLAGAKTLFQVTNPVPQKIAAIAFRKNQAVHVLLANLLPESITARLRLPADRVAVQMVSQPNLATAARGEMPEPESVNLARGEAVLVLPSFSFAVLQCI